MIKKTLCLLAGALLFLFTSCENFLNGSDVKDQLEKTIAYSNAKSFTIIVSQDNTMGSFLSSGEKECKLGYSIDVQFTVKKDLYIYKGLKAVNASDPEQELEGHVEFTQTEKNEERGIYKTSIKLLKESNDILIVPDCTIIPNVVKEECKPEKRESGVFQDSSIKIVFNKPVIISDYFSPVITDSSGQNLADYYGQPYLSADKRILNIPTKKEPRLLDPNGNITTKDIIVKIDLAAISDEEGYTGSGSFQFTYRINKNFDDTPPQLNSVNLFTSADTTSASYKQLAQKNFTNWSAEEFKLYHINDSLYVEFDAIDEDSGIDELLVKEKVIKNVDGTNSNAQARDVPVKDIKIDDESGLYTASYKIETISDGIVELQFFVKDSSNNTNPQNMAKTFYVIKDTSIDTASIKFLQEVGMFEDTQQGWNNAVSIIDGDTQQVELSLSPSTKDYYYNNEYSSEYKIEAFWGYSETACTTPVTKNSQNKYTFTRDINRVAYIKLICTDEVGNTRQIMKYMAPRPDICEGEHSAYNINITNLKTQLIFCNQKASDMEVVSDYSRFIFQFYEDDQNPTNYTQYIINPKELTLPDLQNAVAYAYSQIHSLNYPETVVYPDCIVRLYVTSTIGSFPSPRSINYYQTKLDSSGSTIDEYTEIKSDKDGSIPNIYGEFGPEGKPYIKNGFKVNTSPANNTGCHKIIIEDYLTEAGKDNNVTCTFFVIEYKFKQEIDPNSQNPEAPSLIYQYTFMPETSTRTNNPEFFLPTNCRYKIYIEVQGPDNDGHIKNYIPYKFQYDTGVLSTPSPIKPEPTPLQFTKDNPPACCSFYVNNGTELQNRLVLSGDYTPPTFFEFDGSYLYGPDSFEIRAPDDQQLELAPDYEMSENPETEYQILDTMYVNQNGRHELTYYIIPNPSNNIKLIPTYTINELETIYKDYAKKIEYDSTRITIPYGDISDGYYTISIIAKDIYNNAALVTYPFIKNVLDRLPYTLGEAEQIVQQIDEFTTTGYTSQILTINDDESDLIKTITVNGKDYSTIDAYLYSCSRIPNTETWQWVPNTDNLCYSNVLDENGMQIMEDGQFLKELNYAHELYPGPGSWHKLSSIYGFHDSDSTVGKGFFYTEYLYLGLDPICRMKNCLDYGLNGLQLFFDNTVLVHTMYSPVKLTDSISQDDMESIFTWETRGTETGLVIYPSSRPNPTTQNNQNDQFSQTDPYENDNYDYLVRNYGLDRLESIPKDWWYTTIIHFADGTIITTGIKQKL